MTDPVEGQTPYVSEHYKEGHETATTSSAASVDREKAEANMRAQQEDPVFETTGDDKVAPVDAAAANNNDNDDDDSDGEADYLPMGPKIILITVSLMMAVFCVALDNTVGFHESEGG